MASSVGSYGLQIKKESAKAFLKEFERVYEDADNGIFKMEEWHDSYVFDEVLKELDSVSEINDPQADIL